VYHMMPAKVRLLRAHRMGLRISKNTIMKFVRQMMCSKNCAKHFTPQMTAREPWVTHMVGALRHTVGLWRNQPMTVGHLMGEICVQQFKSCSATHYSRCGTYTGSCRAWMDYLYSGYLEGVGRTTPEQRIMWLRAGLLPSGIIPRQYQLDELLEYWLKANEMFFTDKMDCTMDRHHLTSRENAACHYRIIVELLHLCPELELKREYFYDAKWRRKILRDVQQRHNEQMAPPLLVD